MRNTEIHCDVCGEQIHGTRDRIFTLLPNGTQAQIMCMPVGGVDGDVCMDCIRDVVKNRRFTRAKRTEPANGRD